MRFLILSAALMLSACGTGTPDTAQAPAEGREETRGIRNTDAIGMPGGVIADRVDSALDAQEQHQKKLEQGMPE